MNLIQKIIIVCTWLISVYIAAFYLEHRKENHSVNLPVVNDSEHQKSNEPIKKNSVTVNTKKEVYSADTPLSLDESTSSQNQKAYTYDLSETLKVNSKAEKAYGAFFKSDDKEQAFANDEYDSDWSGETTNRIYNEILYDSESGENKYPSLDVESLICKGTICKLEVRSNGENEDDNELQQSKLMYELLYMNGGNPKNYTGLPSEFVSNRLISTKFYGENGYRYYISKGINELKE